MLKVYMSKVENIMKLKKIFISIAISLLPILGFSGIFSYVIDGLSMQYGAGQTAKKYAEEKFGKNYSVVSENALGKIYQVILQEDDYPRSKCSVSVLTPKEGDQYVPEYNEKTYGVTTCGQVILMRKVSAMVKDEVVSKYFKDNKVGIDITCGKENCNLSDKIDVFNFNNYWNLSAKEWVDKFYPYLQVNRVVVSIFNTPKSAEDIAKAMKMVFELNKYLYDLTGTHQIGSIYIYMILVKKFLKINMVVKVQELYRLNRLNIKIRKELFQNFLCGWGIQVLAVKKKKAGKKH